MIKQKVIINLIMLTVLFQLIYLQQFDQIIHLANQILMEEDNPQFFMRYYIGHRGAYGHQFLDFELDNSGRLKYHNNSQYKSDSLIRKQVYVTQTIIDEMKRIIVDSGILECNDQSWPKPDKVGKQQLVLRIGAKQLTLKTSKIGSYAQVQKTADPNVQDLKCFVFSLVNLHFRIKPI